jgi:uncharacterized protein (UPF0332 family)
MVRAMMAKAMQKLARAQQDLADGFPEEAVSRSYYAAFHAVTAVLATRGLSYSSHAQTIGAFSREFVKTGLMPAGSSRQLRRLFEDRQTADYDCLRTIDTQTATEAVAAAKALLDECQKHMGSATGGMDDAAV